MAEEQTDNERLEEYVINFTAEEGVTMFDALSRTAEGRKIDPLTRYDYIDYDHRYYYDQYNLMIGDVYIMVPPEFIYVASESFSQKVQTLRQENSQKEKTGYHKRTIQVDLVFNGMDEINGYKVPGPEHKDGKKITNYYYVDGLRTLLAQFKSTPFLPITNELLNETYGIYTVALNSIKIESLEGFQNCLRAVLIMQEINMMPYIEMPDIMYQYMIDWDLFRAYTQSFLTENYIYKNLQSLPENRDHTAFKMSVLDETTITNVVDTIDGVTKEDTILKIVTDEKNYNCLIDSRDTDIHISKFTCGYSNVLTSIQMSDQPTPTLQYLGGMDTIFSIVMETTSKEAIANIEQCQINNHLMVRNNPKIRGSIGFVKLDTDFTAFCGSSFVFIENVETATVPGVPGLYQVTMSCVSYDIAQSRREELEGFMPFDGTESSIEDLDLKGDRLESKFAGNMKQAIDQSYAGLLKKIYQDNYAEWKLRTSMEVYPDLRLPTYAEVNETIDKIRIFRMKNGLTQLPYTEYPTVDTHVLYGLGETRKDYPNHFLDNGGRTYLYQDHIEQLDQYKKHTYKGYVDPDFYVFYPYSYTNEYHSEQKENETVQNSTGEELASSNVTKNPIQTKKKTATKTYRQEPNYNIDGDLTENNISGLIARLRQKIGCKYKFRSEGLEKSDEEKTFDSFGLLTFCLKEMGIIPSNQAPISLTTLKKQDIFEEVDKDNIKMGDILASGMGFCGVYTGIDIDGNKSIITSRKETGVAEMELFFKPGFAYRIKAIQKDFKGQGTKQSYVYKSDGDQYPDANGKIEKKPKTALETVKDYESDNKYGSDKVSLSSGGSSGGGGRNGGGNSSGNTVNKDLGVWSPISEKELNAFIKKTSPSSPFNGHADIFIKAGEESGLDPRYLLAHAAVETGWGTSRICKDKNNYFGIGAFDNSPYASAYSFNSGLAAGIIGGAKWIAKHYYNGQYKQRTLHQMLHNSANPNHEYATGDTWDTEIARIMDSIGSDSSATYLSGNVEENGESSGGQSTAVNQYMRMNQEALSAQLAKDTTPVTPKKQVDISKLSVKEFEEDGSKYTDGSVKITETQTMTSDEFNALARNVATACEGEKLNSKMAMAQMLYDKITDPMHTYGGLGAITREDNNFKDQKASVEEKEMEDAKTCIKKVFQDGVRFKKKYRILQVTDTNNGNFARDQRNENYVKVKSCGSHVFWGYKQKGATIGFKIKGHGVSKVSDNGVTNEYKTTINVTRTLKTIRFGHPILIKSKWFDCHDSDRKDVWKELSKTDNRTFASFVDECQYSGKGRMVKAFPTFLFCILDDESQWYDGRKLWTNYYVYRPVVNINFHASNDMPTATATITVTNTYHNLDRSSNALTSYSIKNDDDYGAINKFLYSELGFLIGGQKITSRLIQMHSIIFRHAKVREGSRVHLRMGYGSDPMSLAPIINGTISGMELGDTINITVTSDGHELIQNIVSDDENDINNGAFGTSIGATDEASDIIAEILYARESWINHLFFAGDWFEGNDYNIEHFGLYINSSDEDAFQGGVDVGILDQYDLLMNLYHGTSDSKEVLGMISTGGSFRHIPYYYEASAIPTWDGEDSVVFNRYNMTPWDVFQTCTQAVPEFICKPEMYQFDSRLFYGLPFDLTKYRYDIVDGTIYQEVKTSTQTHFIDSVTNIIENQLSVSSRDTFTNAKVCYMRGGSPTTTSIIHSDDTIDASKQSTHIIDSPISQDYLGWDAAYEFFGIAKQGETCARNVGISNLLYSWQKQYNGQILCLGSPAIKPDDYLMVCDFYSSLNGLTMVREVIHSFNNQTGFTTSIVPGIIGISPEKETGNQYMLLNLLKLYDAFSGYSLDRKLARENCERYNQLISKANSACIYLQGVIRGVENKNWWMDGLDIADDAASITHLVLLTKQIKNMVKFAKNSGSIIKAGKNFFKVIKYANMLTKGAKIFKGTRTLINFAAIISKVSKIKDIGTVIDGAIAGGSAAAAPETAGISLAVGLLVSAAIDIILGGFIDWMKNRNTVMLLPLWWENQPFVSGVKDGERILMIPSTANGSEENTGEEGYDTKEDKTTSVEDN